MFLIKEFKFYCISLDLSSLNRNSIYFFQQPEYLKFPKSAEKKNLTLKFILLSGTFELKIKGRGEIPDAEIEMTLNMRLTSQFKLSLLINQTCS